MNDEESADNELRAAVDERIAELDAGLGEELTAEDLMAGVGREAALVASVVPTS